MKIDPTGPVRPAQTRRVRKSDKGNSGQFSVDLDADAGKPESTSAAQSVGGVSGLLALQEVDGVSQENAEAAARGHDILDHLDEIRHGLLLGAIDREELRQLSARIKEKRAQSVDSRLNEILDEIELRAEVELAKLDR